MTVSNGLYCKSGLTKEEPFRILGFTWTQCGHSNNQTLCHPSRPTDFLPSMPAPRDSRWSRGQPQTTRRKRRENLGRWLIVFIEKGSQMICRPNILGVFYCYNDRFSIPRQISFVGAELFLRLHGG